MGTIDMGVVAAWLAFSLSVSGVLLALYRMVRKLENAQEQGRRNAEMNALLCRACFAILDGLKQMNCNGEVSSMHNELRDFVIKH